MMPTPLIPREVFRVDRDPCEIRQICTHTQKMNALADPGAGLDVREIKNSVRMRGLTLEPGESNPGNWQTP